MRRITVALAAMACAFFAWTGLAAAAGQAGDAIEGSYIVVVKQGSDPKAVAEGKKAKTKHVYRDAVNGFAAELSDQQVADLRADKRVATVEQDRVVTADATQTGADLGPGPHRPAQPPAVGHVHLQRRRRRTSTRT